MRTLIFFLCATIASAQSITAVKLPTNPGNPYGITRSDGTVQWVPQDPANRHYVEVQAWLKGNAATPADPAPDPKIQLRAQAVALQQKLMAIQALQVTSPKDPGLAADAAATQAQLASVAATALTSN